MQITSKVKVSGGTSIVAESTETPDSAKQEALKREPTLHSFTVLRKETGFTRFSGVIPNKTPEEVFIEKSIGEVFIEESAEETVDSEN